MIMLFPTHYKMVNVVALTEQVLNLCGVEIWN